MDKPPPVFKGPQNKYVVIPHADEKDDVAVQVQEHWIYFWWVIVHIVQTIKSLQKEHMILPEYTGYQVHHVFNDLLHNKIQMPELMGELVYAAAERRRAQNSATTWQAEMRKIEHNELIIPKILEYKEMVIEMMSDFIERAMSPEEDIETAKECFAQNWTLANELVFAYRYGLRSSEHAKQKKNFAKVMCDIDKVSDVAIRIVILRYIRRDLEKKLSKQHMYKAVEDKLNKLVGKHQFCAKYPTQWEFFGRWAFMFFDLLKDIVTLHQCKNLSAITDLSAYPERRQYAESKLEESQVNMQVAQGIDVSEHGLDLRVINKILRNFKLYKSYVIEVARLYSKSKCNIDKDAGGESKKGRYRKSKGVLVDCMLADLEMIKKNVINEYGNAAAKKQHLSEWTNPVEELDNLDDDDDSIKEDDAEALEGFEDDEERIEIGTHDTKADDAEELAEIKECPPTIVEQAMDDLMQQYKSGFLQINRRGGMNPNTEPPVKQILKNVCERDKQLNSELRNDGKYGVLETLKEDQTLVEDPNDETIESDDPDNEMLLAEEDKQYHEMFKICPPEVQLVGVNPGEAYWMEHKREVAEARKRAEERKLMVEHKREEARKRAEERKLMVEHKREEALMRAEARKQMLAQKLEKKRKQEEAEEQKFNDKLQKQFEQAQQTKKTSSVAKQKKPVSFRGRFRVKLNHMKKQDK